VLCFVFCVDVFSVFVGYFILCTMFIVLLYFVVYYVCCSVVSYTDPSLLTVFNHLLRAQSANTTCKS
jgi:hypothetical protein